MKFIVKLLLIGIIAATAFYFGQRSRHSTSEGPAPDSAAAPDRVVTTSPTVSTSAFQPLPLPKPANPLDKIKASLHSKLQQWHEAQINDPDNQEGQERLMQEMLAMLTDDNVADIIQSLSAEELNTPFGSGALRRWMQVDATTASNWLASHPATQDQTIAVAEEWNKNPDGLQQYLEQLPAGEFKEGLLTAASSDLALKDPLAAIKLAEKMSPGEGQTNLLRAVACGWVDTDPVAAMQWASDVKDPALREQLVASTVQAYALTDPAQAATWLVEEVKSDSTLKDTALNILNTWVTTDPAAAADWAAHFPEGNLKAEAVKTVAQYWQQTDPAAAAAWIQNLSGPVTAQAQ